MSDTAEKKSVVVSDDQKPALVPEVVPMMSKIIEGRILFFIDHKQPIYVQDNPKPNRKEYEVS